MTRLPEMGGDRAAPGAGELMLDAPMPLIGYVAQWVDRRNYGFIVVARERYFTHANNLVGGGALRPGDVVSFDAADSRQGPRAVNVRRLESCPKCDLPLRGKPCECGFRL